MPSEVEEDLLLQKGRALLRKSKRTEPGGDPRRMQTAGPGRPAAAGELWGGCGGDGGDGASSGQPQPWEQRNADGKEDLKKSAMSNEWKLPWALVMKT